MCVSLLQERSDERCLCWLRCLWYWTWTLLESSRSLLTVFEALHHGDRRAAAQFCAQAASSSFACYLRSWSASRSITQGRKMSDWCAPFPARTPSATANAIAGIGVATSPQAKTPLTVVSFIASVL